MHIYSWMILKIIDWRIALEKVLLGVIDGVRINNYMWCVSAYFNGLWRIDMNTKEAVKMVDLPVKITNSTLAECVEVLEYNNKIILLTRNLTILIYDPKYCTLSAIDIKQNNKYCQDIKVVGGALIINDFLIIYPGIPSGHYAFLYKYNLKTGEISSILLSDKCPSNEYLIFENGYFVYNDKVYFAYASLDFLICYDPMSDYLDTIKYDCGSTKICNVAVMDGIAYLVPSVEGSIITIDLEKRTISKMNEYPVGYKREPYRSIIDIIQIEDDLLLLPAYGNMFLQIKHGKIDINEKLTSLLETISKKETEEIHQLLFCKAKKYGKKIYLFSSKANAVYEFDTETNVIIEIRVFTDDSKLIWSDVVQETGVYNINRYLRHIMGGQKCL